MAESFELKTELDNIAEMQVDSQLEGVQRVLLLNCANILHRDYLYACTHELSK